MAASICDCLLLLYIPMITLRQYIGDFDLWVEILNEKPVIPLLCLVLRK